MKIRGQLVLGVVLLSAVGAFAQDYAKVEIPIGYSYIKGFQSIHHPREIPV